MVTDVQHKFLDASIRYYDLAQNPVRVRCVAVPLRRSVDDGSFPPGSVPVP
jgi:hypothetical protein